MISCLLPWTRKSFKIGSTPKGKNLLQEEQIYTLRVDPIEKAVKIENGGVTSLERDPIPLN